MLKIPAIMPVLNENTFMKELEITDAKNAQELMVNINLIQEREKSIDEFNKEDEFNPLTLTEVPEGVIGKLKIRKSGKIK